MGSQGAVDDLCGVSSRWAVLRRQEAKESDRVYLISTLMSLEANTTPTLEPYFLSLLGSHSLLGTVAIVTNVRSSLPHSQPR